MEIKRTENKHIVQMSKIQSKENIKISNRDAVLSSKIHKQ